MASDTEVDAAVKAAWAIVAANEDGSHMLAKDGEASIDGRFNFFVAVRDALEAAEKVRLAAANTLWEKAVDNLQITNPGWADF